MKLLMVDYLAAVELHGLDAWPYLLHIGHHPNVVYGKALRAAKKDYTEYGVNAKWSWLIDKGRQFLINQPWPVPERCFKHGVRMIVEEGSSGYPYAFCPGGCGIVGNIERTRRAWLFRPDPFYLPVVLEARDGSHE